MITSDVGIFLYNYRYVCHSYVLLSYTLFLNVNNIPINTYIDIRTDNQVLCALRPLRSTSIKAIVISKIASALLYNASKLTIKIFQLDGIGLNQMAIL